MFMLKAKLLKYSFLYSVSANNLVDSCGFDANFYYFKKKVRSFLCF